MRTRFLGQAIRLSLVVAAMAAPAVAADSTLRWKFEKGEKFTYVMVQRTETKADVEGREIGSTQDVIIDLDWDVVEVDAEGTAKVTQTMKRIRFKLESAVGNFDYDSEEKKEIEGPMAILGPMLEGMVNQPVEMQMNNLGEVIAVKVPEKMVESLQKAGPAAAVANSMFSEEGLKKMMSQSMLRFPEKALEKGATWEEKSEMPLGMMGTMALTRTYSYLGASDSNESEQIGLETKVQLIPKENAPVEMSLTKQESDGKILFDNKSGHLLSSDINQKMTINLTVQGQEIKQEVNSSAALQLVTEPATAAP